MHVDPPTIALIKLRLIQMTRNIMLIINLAKIICHRSLKCMNLNVPD